MSKQIFINLPITDLQKSVEFYTAMGASLNPQFSDATAACMVFSDAIYVMLLTHTKWQGFTKKPITDTSKSGAALYALTLESKSEVDGLLERASKSGGTIDVNPVQDLGFMYSRSVSDPDGHVWEPFFMDLSQMPAG